MSAIKSKGSTVVWGTGGVSAAASGYGVCLSANRALSTEKEEIPDENGNAQGVVYYNEKEELTIEALCKTNVTMPAIGDTISVDGVSGYVESAEKKWEHKGTMKISVKAQRLVSGGIP